ncbi:MAG: ABC transporter permease [Muricomes sp.]
MTVFKAYMKIMKRNIGLILMYLGVFMVITFIIQSVTKNQEKDGYQAESVKIGFVDEDGGTLAKGLADYLGTFHKIIPMDNDKGKLQEDLFYRNIEYIVKIPAGFEDACIKGNEKLSVTKVPGSYTSFYVDQQINNFLNSVKTYHAAGYTVSEALDAIAERPVPKVTMLDVNGHAGEVPVYTYYYRYIPYLLLSILCYVLGNILSAFHKGDIPKRMQASAISTRRQNMEGLLAAMVLGVVLLGICIGVSLLLYGKDFIQSSGFVYYLLNSLTMLFVALSISYLVGMLVSSPSALNGIVNTISLGMCFLCGVFVPLDIMSKGVKTVAQFLPVYWYERANDKISEFSGITGAVRTEILQAIGIQIVFVAALVSISMVAAGRRRQGK